MYVLKKIFSSILTLCLIFSVQALAFNEREEHFSDKNIEFGLGDVNLNGRTTAVDARLSLRASALLIILAGDSLINADFNEDGKITTVDARSILKFAIGLDHYATPVVRPETTTKEPETQTQIATATKITVITSNIINVPLFCQYPEYPTGCESVAAIMNLQYYGLNISVADFVDKYLYTGTTPYKEKGVWYSSDPNESFLGNPRSEYGWGIWAKGLERAIQRCIDCYTGDFCVKSTYSETLDSLCKKYIDKNIPVLVWGTAYMEPPRVNITPYIIGTDKTFTWISPNHCMLLVGYDENNYYFNDPLTGKLEKYTKTTSDIAFKGNGSQAVVITKQ